MALSPPAAGWLTYGMRRPSAGDRVTLEGTIEDVRDDLVIVRVDSLAPHAVPGRYDLVILFGSSLEPDGPVPWHTPLARQLAERETGT